MKKLFATLALLAVVAMPVSASTLGFVYQNATTPGDGYAAVSTPRTGSATCTTYFYIVGLGDCSVKAAMKRGGISTLAFYDVYKKNILGYQKITVKAYGN